MVQGRKSIGVAMGLALTLCGGAWAQDKSSKPPPVFTPEVNQCRALCGQGWIRAQSCEAVASVCARRADRAYRQCLPDCDTGKTPMAGAFSWLKPPLGAPLAVAVAKPASPAQDAAPRKPSGADGLEPSVKTPWVAALAEWTAMPGHFVVGLPNTFVLPRQAYGYAAITRALPARVGKSPSLLLVEVEVHSGVVGVALSAPDGSALISKEVVLKPSLEVQTVTFPVGPQTPPAAILVRNRDEGGAPGSVTVISTTFTRNALLTRDARGGMGVVK